MANEKEKEAAEKAAAEAAEQEAAEKAAAEAAEQEAAAKAALDDGLVALTKDGDTLRAHPVQVPLWLAQGWSEVAD